jgi:hypothetical protein
MRRRRSCRVPRSVSLEIAPLTLRSKQAMRGTVERERHVATSVSKRLCRKLDLVQDEVSMLNYALLHHPRRAALYPEYLITAHSISKGFKPLMNTVLERSRSMARHDRVADGMAVYLTKHITDEANEDMVVDLEVLGFTRSEIERRRTSPSVAALIGAQYFWSLHVHPVALLGSLQVLEGYPPSRELVDELVACTGLPARAFQSMYEHAEVDVNHRDEVHELLDTLPLTDDHEVLIGISAFQTVDLLGRAFHEVYTRHT